MSDHRLIAALTEGRGMTPFEISSEMPKKGFAGGVIDRASKGLLDRWQYMRPGEAERALGIASDIYYALFEAMGESLGWWRIVTILNVKKEYDVPEFAARLVVSEMLTIHDIVIRGHRWLVTSKPECNEDHLHSTRLMHDGLVECADATLSAAAVRKLHYAPA